jgi:two-component system CheB/CheR fusion protein
MTSERATEVTDTSRETPRPFPIVALGASAGGLAAVTQLLRRLGNAPGLAIVLIQHLDPTHPSNLAQLLARVTEMPVETALDGAVVLVNHAYVIPPDADMEIERGTLRLTPRTERPGPHLPIDLFFDSLADDRGPGAIAVVLSGTGADGARGVQAVKTEGGITFAQSGAEHDGMPRSAIATGCVDFELPAEDIAIELARIGGRRAGGEDDGGPDEGTAFHRIIHAIRRSTGVDLANYKPATLRRRMQRRAILRRVGSLREYADLVAAEPAEVEALSEEVLIHVTRFFRDPEVFDALKKDVFPRLLGTRADGPIRIWVPGCSTGEEVYSIAICVLELLASTDAPQVPVKIFGTDVSRRAIERARAGVYPEIISEDVEPASLARFFLKTERGYEIVKEVRERCVFATHDITRDPPFSKMDLISCRNLMIYLGPALQQRILPMFHYALKESGFLVLGSAETVGTSVGFTAADSKNKIYTRGPGPVMLAFDFGDARGWSAPTQVPPRSIERVASMGDVRRDADRAILAATAPAGVVVTDDLGIVEFRGEIGPYLEPIPGVATLDLLRMAREELRLTLRRGIDEARSTGKPTRSAGVTVGSGESRCTIEVDVIPFNVPPGSARFFAVLFTERAATARTQVGAPENPADVAAEDELRKELGSTREYLQSVIEQLEAGNEELKAANEEIVSSNEELQSTNEELQTAKEELQATNEELRTVNDEMLDRNAEASRLADDLTNVLSSVAIPIVILGRDSRIRRFTPAATKILNLLATDIGREIRDLEAKTHIPDLTALVAEVLQHLVPMERTVQAEGGRWYQVGIRPYRTLDNRIDGTVLSVYDIDALKKAELLLAEARDYAESIVDTMGEALVVLDGALRVRSTNRAFLQQFKTTLEQIEGRRLDTIGAYPRDLAELRRLLDGLLRGEAMGEIRFEHQLPELGSRVLVAHGRRMAKTGWLLLTLADVTDRARMEDRLAKSEAGFRRMLTSAAEAIVMSDPGGRVVFANEMARRIFGYAEPEMLALHIDALLPRRDGSEQGKIGLRRGGTEFPVEVTQSPMDGSEGRLLVAFIADITARREAERKIKDYQVSLQRMAFGAALAEERERRRIAQDLHDGVGQSLALARMKLEAGTATAQGSARDAMFAAIDLIATSIEDTRTLTFDLAPPVLYDLGLKPALSWLCEEVEKRSGVHVEISDDGSNAPFEEATAALIFRTVRELLTNVFKHAQTRAARLSLGRNGDFFEIQVKDAGAGFDVDRAARATSAGFGLFSVREQIARLGGTVDIESTPRQGTHVTLRVPFSAKDSKPSSQRGGGAR